MPNNSVFLFSVKLPRDLSEVTCCTYTISFFFFTFRFMLLILPVFLLSVFSLCYLWFRPGICLTRLEISQSILYLSFLAVIWLCFRLFTSDTAMDKVVARSHFVREGTFLLGGVGWVGAMEGRVISKYFTYWGGTNLFYTQPGEGHSFFLARKKLLHVG